MKNGYLAAKVAEYNAIVSTVDGLQERAVAEGRDLSEEELRSVKSQSDAATKLQGEIKLLTDVEKRAENVRSMTVETVATSTVTAVDRDPGHYRSTEQGGRNSFFGDQFRAQFAGDYAAQQRLAEHQRANQTTATVAGVIPPRWITDLFTNMPAQDAALANAPGVSRYEIADANPFYLPGQTARTVVANQSSESAAITAGDAYDAAAAGPISPSTIVGKEIVSRQLLDGSTPAVDQLIIADLNRSYVAERENRIGVALRAADASPIAVDLSDLGDHTAANYGPKLVNTLAFAVRKAMKARATFLAVDYDAMEEFLGLEDSTGRPLIVGGAQGPNNAAGIGNLLSDGMMGGLPFVVSDGMAGVSGEAGKAEVAAVYGPAVIYFESPQLNFRYEEVAGPQQIVLGLWRYFAVTVRDLNAATGGEVRRAVITDDVS